MRGGGGLVLRLADEPEPDRTLPIELATRCAQARTAQSSSATAARRPRPSTSGALGRRLNDERSASPSFVARTYLQRQARRLQNVDTTRQAVFQEKRLAQRRRPRK